MIKFARSIPYEQCESDSLAVPFCVSRQENNTRKKALERPSDGRIGLLYFFIFFLNIITVIHKTSDITKNLLTLSVNIDC